MSPSQAVAKADDVKELCAYGAGLQSLSEIANLHLLVNLEILSLHGNCIQSMQGLQGLHRLKELNLSSNNIVRMECLSHLAQLQVLNLSCNRISEISDVRGLVAVKKLLLSHNKISRLVGLSGLHGPSIALQQVIHELAGTGGWGKLHVQRHRRNSQLIRTYERYYYCLDCTAPQIRYLRYSLEILDLRDNAVNSLSELEVLAGCCHLRELIFAWGSHTNPVCQAPAYKSAVIAAAPYICRLDGVTISPGSEAGNVSQKLSKGVDRHANASCLVPSWVSEYACDGHQEPKHVSDRTCPSRQVAEMLQPYQVSPHSGPQAPISSNHGTHQVRRLDGHHHGNELSYHSNLNEGQQQHQMPASGQPSLSRAHRPMYLVPRSCGPTQDPLSVDPTRIKVDKFGSPVGMDHSGSDSCIATESLPIPDVSKASASSDLQFSRAGSFRHMADFRYSKANDTAEIGGKRVHGGSNPRKQIDGGDSTKEKIDSSDQTNHDAWLGVLEEKILTLIQNLPRPERCHSGVKKDSCDNGELSLPISDTLLFQTSNRKDDPGHIHSQRSGKASIRGRKRVADSSSGDISGKSELKPRYSEAPLLGSGDSESESSKSETPARRWIQFGSKWNRRKDLAKTLGRNVNPTKEHDTHEKDLASSGGISRTESKVLEDRKSIMKLFDEVKNLQADFSSLTAKCREREAAQATSEKQRAPCTEWKRSDEEASLKPPMEGCSVLDNNLTSSGAKLSEEWSSQAAKLEAEQDQRRKFFEKLEMEQVQSSSLQKRLNTELEAVKRLHERLEAEVKEKSDLRQCLETKELIISDLKKLLQEKNDKEQELRREVEQLLAKKAKSEELLREQYHEKFLSLDTEVISLKEALSIATQARQNAESALLDAVAEKEKARQLCHVLDEDCTKLKMCKSELEACRERETQLQNKMDRCAKDFLDEQRKKREEIKELVKLHKDEMNEAVARESALAHNRGIISAENSFEQRKNALNNQLTNTQKELREARHENARIRQEMDTVLGKKEKEEAVLKETVRGLLQKEEGKESLVVQLSSVVRSQRIKLQAAKLDLEHLAETEEELHKTQQEMVSLRRRADRCDELVAQVIDLQQRLREASHTAETKIEGIESKFQMKLSSLQKDNTRLTTDLEKLQKAEDAVKIKNKMLDSQNETIQTLKLEVAQVKEAFKKALQTSELLETEWIARLQSEVNKGETSESKFAEQELTITSLEEKLKFERSAKLGSERLAKSLQEKLNEKENMFRYVEDEIVQVKELYDNKFREEQEQGAENLRKAQETSEVLERAFEDAQKRAKELSEANEAFQIQGALWKEDSKAKDQQLKNALQRVADLETEFKSQGRAIEQQKVMSASKLDQLHKLVEEFRQINHDSGRDRTSSQGDSS